MLDSGFYNLSSLPPPSFTRFARGVSYKDIEFSSIQQAQSTPFSSFPANSSKIEIKNKQTTAPKTGQKKQQTAIIYLSFFLGRSWLL